MKENHVWLLFTVFWVTDAAVDTLRDYNNRTAFTTCTEAAEDEYGNVPTNQLRACYTAAH